MTRKQGSGIPAKGPGWGGPARGYSRKPFTAESAKYAQAGRFDPARKSSNDARAERMKEILAEIAESESSNPHARVAAASALLDRIEGKPAQVQVKVDGGTLDDWTDDELKHAAEKLRAGVTGAH